MQKSFFSSLRYDATSSGLPEYASETVAYLITSDSAGVNDSNLVHKTCRSDWEDSDGFQNKRSAEPMTESKVDAGSQ